MDDGTGGSLPPPSDGDGGNDILDLVDRLEELVGVGRRLPFGDRVVISEGDFLAIVDQLRVTVPQEIRQAQRLLKEREQIIGAAQDEAGKILEAARQQAEYIVSQQGVLNEARQRGEELLRQVEIDHRRSLGQIDQYALEQFTKLEVALQDGLHVIASVVQEITA
jgi:vacuolar-type H+-ATPase subunit H